jgi:hypothetical protein
MMKQKQIPHDLQALMDHKDDDDNDFVLEPWSKRLTLPLPRL